jgi:hypothetical protein
MRGATAECTESSHEVSADISNIDAFLDTGCIIINRLKLNTMYVPEDDVGSNKHILHCEVYWHFHEDFTQVSS